MYTGNMLHTLSLPSARLLPLDNKIFETIFPTRICIDSKLSFVTTLVFRRHCCRRRKCVAIFDACDSRSTENEDTLGMFANECAWVDRFWHDERVSVQLGDRETRVASTFTLSPSLSLPLSPFSTHPFLSRILFLSHPTRLLSGAPRRAVSASSASASSRRSSFSLSLFLSFSSRLSRWRPQHRDATTRSVDYSHPGRDAAVNFPTIYIRTRTWPSIIAIGDIRKQVFFFSRVATSKVFSFDLHKRRKGADSYDNCIEKSKHLS